MHTINTIAVTRHSGLTYLANVAEGTFKNSKTFLSDGAITPRYSLVKFGSDAAHVTLAGAADIPIGVATDETVAAEEPINVDLFGIGSRTKLGIASGAIAHGAPLVADANGQIRTLPTTTGTYYIIGTALNDTSNAGDTVEFIPRSPAQRVVA